MKTRSEYPSEQADKFLVRLPDGMRVRIAEAAAVNQRSMNAEIISRLERSFSEHDDDAVEKFLALAMQRLEEKIADKKQWVIDDFDPKATEFEIHGPNGEVAILELKSFSSL